MGLVKMYLLFKYVDFLCIYEGQELKKLLNQHIFTPPFGNVLERGGFPEASMLTESWYPRNLRSRSDPRSTEPEKTWVSKSKKSQLRGPWGRPSPFNFWWMISISVYDPSISMPLTASVLKEKFLPWNTQEPSLSAMSGPGCVWQIWPKETKVELRNLYVLI